MIYVSERDTNVPGPRGSSELWKSRVPGIAIGDQKKLLEKNSLFEEYDIGNPPKGPVDDTDIFVNLPTDPHLLFASGRFLSAIGDGYPESYIHVQCPEWFWPYLPERVEPIKSRQAKYYREFNLGRGFNPIQQATTPWSRLYFTETSVPEVNWKLPVQMKSDVVPTIDIAIIGNGFHATTTQGGLSEGLEHACHNAGYSTTYMHSPDDPGSAIPLVAGARSVIACGDSAYAYAAVAMGKPTLVFTGGPHPDGAYKMHDNRKQYASWPNVRQAIARHDYTPDAMDVLNAHVKLCLLCEVPLGGEDE